MLLLCPGPGAEAAERVARSDASGQRMGRVASSARAREHASTGPGRPLWPVERGRPNTRHQRGQFGGPFTTELR